MWAAPSVEHLASIMLEVYQMPWDLRIMRSENGKRLLLASFSWAHVAGRLVNSAYSFSRTFINLQPRFGFVTTWHTRCGIATYSEHLISNTLNSSTIFAAKGHQLNEIDSSNVVRCWTQGEDDSLDELINNIREQRIDAIVIQFNYGFFNFEKFNIFLHRLLTDGCVVVVTLHSTTDPLHIPNKCLKDLRLSLSLCHRLLVHTLDDLNRLKAIGLIENVTLFPHGIPSYEPPSNTNFRGRGIGASSGDLIVASYGFFLPHKGLLELIDAIYILNMSGRIFQLYMINAEYPAPESAVLIQTARDKISQLGLNEVIKMTTDYLPDEESLSLLAKADLIVFPYQNTGESSSAAVRYGIASGRPVAVTPLSIFGDVSHLVYQLPGQTPQDIATGIRQVLHEIASDSDSLTARAATKKRWRETHSYIALGRRLDGMLQALVRQRQRKIDSSGGSDAHNKPSQVLNSMGHSSRF
jgi:glycosyltransferase involved in cell wall biosynthesis